MADFPGEWRVREKIRKLEENMGFLETKYKVKEIGVFGSFVHNTQQGKSDLDILVEFKEPPSLLEFIEMEQYLSSLLGVKVDLVMKNSLKKHIGRRILKEVVYL